MAYALYYNRESGKIHIRRPRQKDDRFRCGKPYSSCTSDYIRISNLLGIIEIRDPKVLSNDEEMLRFFCESHGIKTFKVEDSDYGDSYNDTYNFCGNCMSTIIGND